MDLSEDRPLGARIGSYEVVAKLGEGGMGVVYRARDARLGRDVAIKVLPPAFAADPQRVARFEREAQTLAALNHPNIAQIYGVADIPPEGGNYRGSAVPPEGVSSGGAKGAIALVMELVEGEDLAQRLARGAIPLDDALPIARQIADAVEAAHERGIVHRDLKPANVKVAPDGAVKVLDFGLALVRAPESAAVPEAANSPTFTSPATQHGVILGTAAYMAPEQARGKVVDRRADVWAFGCLVYELLTGARPFDGETVTDVLSAIVSKEPDWTRLPSATPPALAALLRRCLEKDPRKRLRDIGEARVLLEQPLAAATGTASAAPRKTPVLVVAFASAAAVLAIALAGVVARNGIGARTSAPRPITRYDLTLPDAASVDIVFRPAVSVSADGSTFAFVGTSAGVDRIYVRSRGDAAPRLLPGSERGSNPALSRDGRWVAFFSDDDVRKASIDGGVTTIATSRDVRGISWIDDTTLVLSADAGAPVSTLPAAGGTPHPITSMAPGERTHRWPEALPGGTAVLFTVGSVAKPDTYDDSNIDLVMIASGERRVLIKGAAMARYCGGGRLVYSKGPSLYAVPFDVARLEVTGPAVQIVQGVERDASTGAAHFDCSEEGTLAYVPGLPEGDLRVLTWMDREGHAQPLNVRPGPYQEARVSPDGSRIAMISGTSGAGDVWMHDVTAGTLTRVTFTGDCAAPIWSADGRTIYYSRFDGSGRGSTMAKKAADGSREAETLGTTPGRSYLAQVDEARGFAILDLVEVASDRGDVVRVPIAAAGPTERLVSSPFNEFSAVVSTDGRWLAYQSDETGRPEVYVRDLSGSGARHQVSSTGAEEPHWSRDGRELYYRSVNRLFAVPIATAPAFSAGNPRPLFDGIYNSGIESGRSYDVDPAGGRFLLVVPARETKASGTVRVVLNWDAALPASR